MNRQFPTSEAWELQSLGKPHAVSSLDANLGPNQVRYQARFYDHVDDSYIDISINYDPTTCEFGIIKPASGK
jgi:hypothetical protein